METTLQNEKNGDSLEGVPQLGASTKRAHYLTLLIYKRLLINK